MLNIVDTSSVSAPPLRSMPQQSATQAPQQQAPIAPLPDFTVSSIRVDNHLDLAILEFKSASTGDVMRQYPTEKQIAGYQRAAQLESNKEQRIEVGNSTDVMESGQSQSRAAESTNSSSPAPQQQSNASAGTSGGETANVTQGMATLSNTASTGGTTQSYSA